MTHAAHQDAIETGPLPRCDDQSGEQPLNRTWRLSLTMTAALGALAIAVGVFLRLFRLDAYILTAGEGRWAYQAWSLAVGKPVPAGQEPTRVAPLFQAWDAIVQLAFGSTDATARLAAVIAGLAMILVVPAFGNLLPIQHRTGMMVMLAISPTVVFASRTLDPNILIACFALTTVIAFLRTGAAECPASRLRWAAAAGLLIGCMFSAGPKSLSVLIAMAIGVAFARVSDAPRKQPAYGAVTASLRVYAEPSSVAAALVGVIVAVVVSFTRFFSDLTTARGVITTFQDWASSIARDVTNLPFSFHFWSLLLYEPLAIVLALFAVSGLARLPASNERHASAINPSLWVGWFLAALILFSFSSGRRTEDAVFVALPLALLAGHGLGDLLASVQRRPGNRSVASWVGLAIAALLAVFTFRSDANLAWIHGNDGSELLARSVPTEQTASFLHQVERLSRDISVDELSNVDNAGQHSLNVAIDPTLQWPFTWYFREYQSLSIVPPAGYDEDVDVAIAPSPDGMEAIGLSPRQVGWRNRPPTVFVDLSPGDVLGNLAPSRWSDAWAFLWSRKVSSEQEPALMSVGYSNRLANKVNPDFGPFDLFGPDVRAGSSLGRLQSPSGVAISADGAEIYVVDAGNRRIQRYALDGTFEGVWDSQSDPAFTPSWVPDYGQGMSSITVDDDGLVYVTDTWNHIVVVLNPDGQVVRQLGQPGAPTDLGDQPGVDPTDKAGYFFGPRSVAINNGLIYVSDTGNERIQVFETDGTPVRQFGGYGSDAGRLIEPTGIAFGPDGNLWVADSGNARISIFTPDGRFVRSIAVDAWQGQAGLDRNNVLAFGENGILYLTAPLSNAVLAYNGESFAEAPNAGWSTPVGLAFTPDGRLLVVDRSSSRVIRTSAAVPGFDAMQLPAATPQSSPAASPASSPEATPATSPRSQNGMRSVSISET